MAHAEGIRIAIGINQLHDLSDLHWQSVAFPSALVKVHRPDRHEREHSRYGKRLGTHGVT